MPFTSRPDRAFLFFSSAILLIASCTNSRDSKSNSDTSLDIAPYQQSAVTIVSPDGKNTKAATFERFSGKMKLKKDLPSSVEFSVQTSSVVTSDKKLVGILKEKDFFDVERYPTAEFKSTDIHKDTSTNAAPNAYVVSGALDIKGKKINMNVPANVDMNEKEISMSIQLPITSKAWLDKFSTSPDAFFKDHLDVVAKLVFPKPVAMVEKKEPVQEIRVDEIKKESAPVSPAKSNTTEKSSSPIEKKVKLKNTSQTGVK